MSGCRMRIGSSNATHPSEGVLRSYPTVRAVSTGSVRIWSRV